ncbi:MAG: N-acetyltransferase family protein [Microcystaceae cyanobacterium]
MEIRTAKNEDLDLILALYRRVAANSTGLARLAYEIDRAYVLDFLNNAINQGVGLVALDQSKEIKAEIHAYSLGIYRFSHILTNLTLVVDLDSQGQGVGTAIFERFLQKVINEMPHILRVELIACESSQKAIHLYEQLGFKIEGRLENRIMNKDGSLEADIPMAWMRHTQSD